MKPECIVPCLDAIIRSYTDPSPHARISACHRLVGVALLRRHYRDETPRGITCMYDHLPFSKETIRRAVRDGIDMGYIEVISGTDKRYKRIRASQLLIDTFESMHVESDDARTKTKGDRDGCNKTNGTRLSSRHENTERGEITSPIQDIRRSRRVVTSHEGESSHGHGHITGRGGEHASCCDEPTGTRRRGA